MNTSELHECAQLLIQFLAEHLNGFGIRAHGLAGQVATTS
jgi:hypothetical protein